MKTPILVFAQSEVNPHNTDTEALFGYFEHCEKIPPTDEDIQELYEKRAVLRANGVLSIVNCLGWSEVDFDPTPRPNRLSDRTGLKRFFIGTLG